MSASSAKIIPPQKMKILIQDIGNLNELLSLMALVEKQKCDIAEVIVKLSQGDLSSVLKLLKENLNTVQTKGYKVNFMNFNTVKCNTKEVVHQLFDVLSLAEKWLVGFMDMTFPPVKTIFVGNLLGIDSGCEISKIMSILKSSES